MKATPSSIPKYLLYGLKGILCLGLLGVIVLGAFFCLPANIHYHVTEKYGFSGIGEDAPVYFGVMLPKSGPYQSIENVDIVWAGDIQEDDHDFVDVIKFYGNKRSQEDLEATIEYDVKLPQGTVSWSTPVENFQRQPQAGIESDCDCIQDQASRLCEGMSEEDAYEIYSFTSDYLTYSPEDKDCTSISALQAYKIGTCVCAGYARLMTALCRASGIPAQMMIGLVYPDSMHKSHATSFPKNPQEAHAWVEYYSEESWKMADPTWATENLKFLQFNRNDGRHLAYGELEQVLAIDKGVEMWALDQAEFVLGDDSCFRYIATSSSDQISFLPITSIRKGWDGRWANTLIVWGITVWLLCRYRKKIVSLPQ